MTDALEIVRGRGNVFRDFGDAEAELEQVRAVLAAAIIGEFDRRKLSVRAAERLTGAAASAFSRLRNVRLERFTIDRMIAILGKLGQDVAVTARARPRRRRSARALLQAGCKSRAAAAARSKLSLYFSCISHGSPLGGERGAQSCARRLAAAQAGRRTDRRLAGRECRVAAAGAHPDG